jgi:hypothetical protein
VWSCINEDAPPHAFSFRASFAKLRAKPTYGGVIAAGHVYLAAGHLWQLIAGDVQWTHCWKGFGALAGVYVFAALASRGFARTPSLYHVASQQR